MIQKWKPNLLAQDSHKKCMGIYCTKVLVLYYYQFTTHLLPRTIRGNPYTSWYLYGLMNVHVTITITNNNLRHYSVDAKKGIFLHSEEVV